MTPKLPLKLVLWRILQQNNTPMHWTEIKEVLEAQGVRKSSSAIAQALQEMSRGEPVVFKIRKVSNGVYMKGESNG